MFFKNKNNRQCIPFCALVDGEPLPVVTEARLLGLILDDRLSWWPLVRDTVQRAKAKIWSLVKLRDAGANVEQLVELYIARVRGTIEYGAQVYGPLLNAGQDEELEGLQRKCVQIVLGPRSKSYRSNLEVLGLEDVE